MNWFKRAEAEVKLADRALEDAERRKKQEECKHNGSFRCYGWNRSSPPHVTCMECMKEIGLDEALNVYFERLDKLLTTH